MNIRFCPFLAGYIKIILCDLILLSLIVGFLCISFIHAMPAQIHMSGMHTTHVVSSVTLNTCCNAGVTDHMELWKGTLVGILQGLQDMLALIIVGVAVAFTCSFFLKISRAVADVLFFRYRQYIRTHPDIGICNMLQLAFACGILHPKTH